MMTYTFGRGQRATELMRRGGGAELLYNRSMGLLWFRRSKAKATPPVPAAPPAEPAFAPPPAAPPRAAAASGQVRVPLRLRGLLLLNLKPADGVEQIEKAPPLGRRDEVIMALQGVAPGISFDADGKADYIETDYRLTIDLGPRQSGPHGGRRRGGGHRRRAAARGHGTGRLARLRAEGRRVRRAGCARPLRAVGRHRSRAGSDPPCRICSLPTIFI